MPKPWEFPGGLRQSQLLLTSLGTDAQDPRKALGNLLQQVCWLESSLFLLGIPFSVWGNIHGSDGRWSGPLRESTALSKTVHFRRRVWLLALLTRKIGRGVLPMLFLCYAMLNPTTPDSWALEVLA